MPLREQPRLGGDGSSCTLCLCCAAHGHGCLGWVPSSTLQDAGAVQQAQLGGPGVDAAALSRAAARLWGPLAAICHAALALALLTTCNACCCRCRPGARWCGAPSNAAARPASTPSILGCRAIRLLPDPPPLQSPCLPAAGRRDGRVHGCDGPRPRGRGGHTAPQAAAGTRLRLPPGLLLLCCCCCCCCCRAAAILPACQPDLPLVAAAAKARPLPLPSPFPCRRPANARRQSTLQR